MINNYDNPWAGLASYQDPDTCLVPLKFCGRENESYDVMQLVEDNLFVTLYGKSGTGKTSLLNAGVFPRLRSDMFMPISIRLAMESMDTSFQKCIISKISDTLSEKGCRLVSYDVTPMPDDEQYQEYLWSFFARTHFEDINGRPFFVVIVLDQFEEVFKKRKNEAEVLLRQIYYMMDDNHALSDRIVNGEKYSYDFNYRFVLSIREDDLYSLEDSIDNNYLISMKHCRYRLRSLTREGAREAILKPGEGLFDEREVDKVVNAIIGTAQNKEDGSISTNVLSLICSQLFIESKKAGDSTVSDQLVQKYIEGNPFETYYYKATNGFSNKERSYIERHLVDSSGRRDSVSESDFFLHVKNGEALLEGPKKILQRVSVSSDSKDNRIELIHDSFCAPLVELKQKRQQRRRLHMLFSSVSVAVLCLFIAAFIFYQKRQVEVLNRSMLDNNSRFVAERVVALTDEGDSYLARLLALEILPPSPGRSYIIEAEAALRNASYHNSAILKGHNECIYFVSFNDDGSRVLSMSTDSIMHIWDASNGKLLETKKTLPVPRNVTTVVSPNGYLKAKVSDDVTMIDILDNRTGQVIGKLKGHSGKINCMSFSPDGSELASASDDNTIRTWNVQNLSDKCVFVGHTNDVTCLSYSPDGNRIVSGSEDNTVRLWDVYGNSSKRVHLKSGTEMMNSCFSQDGNSIASASFIDGIISVWDAQTGEIEHSFKGNSYIQNICFHPVEKQILVTSSDSTLKVWNMVSGAHMHTLTGHHDNILSISFSNDGKILLSASKDKTIRIWDACSYKLLKVLSGHKASISYAVCSDNGDFIASASDDNLIKLWDVNTGKCQRTFVGHKDKVKYVSFSPTANQLVSVSDGNTIKVWDIKTGKTVRSFKSHRGKMIYVSFYSENIIVSASQEDGLIRVWDVASGIKICDLDGYDNMLTAVCISPQQHFIRSIFFDGTSEQWDYPSLTKLIEEIRTRFEAVKLSQDQLRKFYLE